MRTKTGVVTRRRHKRLFKQVKGFRHGRKNLYKRAHEALMSSLQHAMQDRKKKKGEMRALWITRINAAVRLIDPAYSYSRFMSDLREAKIDINRKILADLAVNDAGEFAKIVDSVRASA